MIRQGQDLEAILATDEARRLHPAILQPFRRANNRYVRNADEWVPSVQERFEIEKRIARMLQEAGVSLLAGTDASTAAVFPGHSFPTEVELLVEAGLTPVEALRAATINPGQFFERCLGPETLVGRLAPGYEADLLLLEDNPLDDVTALRDLVGVMLDGRWFPREELDSKLQGLEEDYAALGDEVIALERALFSGDAESARVIFDRVRAERPDEFVFSQYTPFFVGYGFLYGEDGFSTDPERLATALGLYEMYAETYPDYHSAHYMLALARRANGDVEGARASLERGSGDPPRVRQGSRTARRAHNGRTRNRRLRVAEARPATGPSARPVRLRFLPRSDGRPSLLRRDRNGRWRRACERTKSRHLRILARSNLLGSREPGAGCPRC